MPVTGDSEPRGALVYQCYKAYKDLSELHFRDSDFPSVLKDAAALYDTVLSVAGLHARLFATVDLAGPFAASARILSHLDADPLIDRLRKDFLQSAEDLKDVPPVEAALYQMGGRDDLSEERLKKLDFVTHDRFQWFFDWLTGSSVDRRDEWVGTLFEDVAERLNIGRLIEFMPEPDKTMSDKALFGAWIEKQEAWLRDTVAVLPDYAARRDDHAEIQAILKEYVPDSISMPRPKYDPVLFDLLMEKGIRRTGSTLLKQGSADGTVFYRVESKDYEHHEALEEVDWVWLINTTDAPQIYYQSADQPFLEDANWREPEDYNATFVAKQRRAIEEESKKKKAEKNEKWLEDKRRREEKRQKRLAVKKRKEEDRKIREAKEREAESVVDAVPKQVWDKIHNYWKSK